MKRRRMFKSAVFVCLLYIVNGVSGQECGFEEVTLGGVSGVCRTADGGGGTFVIQNCVPEEGANECSFEECESLCLEDSSCVAFESINSSQRCELHTEQVATVDLTVNPTARCLQKVCFATTGEPTPAVSSTPEPTPQPTTLQPTTPAPTTPQPTTLQPTTPAPTTPQPTTPQPTTPAPTTPQPTTPQPTTPEPTTPEPTTPEPTTLAPSTPAPTTPEPTTLAPSTPAPTTEGPTTPAPTTPEPTTPAPTTQGPTTPAPTTPAPTTPRPTTPRPTTPAPTTPPPTTPRPTTPRPTPEPTTPVPTKSPTTPRPTGSPTVSPTRSPTVTFAPTAAIRTELTVEFVDATFDPSIYLTQEFSTFMVQSLAQVFGLRDSAVTINGVREGSVIVDSTLGGENGYVLDSKTNPDPYTSSLARIVSESEEYNQLGSNIGFTFSDPSDDSGSDLGLIIGIAVAGSVIVIILVSFCIWRYVRNKKKMKELKKEVANQTRAGYAARTFENDEFWRKLDEKQNPHSGYAEPVPEAFPQEDGPPLSPREVGPELIHDTIDSDYALRASISQDYPIAQAELDLEAAVDNHEISAVI